MLTVTDLFCGAGGSSLGAQQSGIEVRMAINHWKLAIETHNTNFPDTDHDCQDVQATDPRRYRSTDILIASPECTNHSLAKGARRRNLAQGDLWAKPTDPAEIRSRATMWDVCRFAEAHRYRLIIVENVIDATMWECWEAWLAAMTALGYDHKTVSLNSMFCWPTPQSRDRLYIVFWRRGNRAPDLEIRPPAPCPKCARVVEAQQSWKNGRKVGRYKRQYVFTCPTCRGEVTPFYYAALNAIDFSLPAERIGDRKRPLRPRTLERIRFGLEKYGRQPLRIITNMTTDRGRACVATDPMFVQAGSSLTALVSPWVVETMFTHAGSRRAYGVDAPLSSQTGKQSMGVVIPPALMVQTGYRDGNGHYVRSAGEPGFTQTSVVETGVALPWLVTAGSRETAPAGAAGPTPTLTGSERFGLALPPAFLPVLRRNMDAGGLGDPLATVCASGGHHALLIQPAAVISMRSADPLAYSPADPLPVQIASASQSFMLQRAPFLSAYYGGSNVVAGAGEPVPTCTGLDRHAVVDPGEEAELAVEDCYFRMLSPGEVGAAMAFPGSYVVLGNARDRVKQYGNAVTPPAMLWLIRQAVASLHPEVAGR